MSKYVWPGKELAVDPSFLEELQKQDITIPDKSCVWQERLPVDYSIDPLEEEWSMHIALPAPIFLPPAFLWCAFAGEFSSIHRRPACAVYLFNLKDRVITLPYDVRGMDVEPNHSLVAELYRTYKEFLPEYNQKIMAATFERLNS